MSCFFDKLSQWEMMVIFIKYVFYKAPVLHKLEEEAKAFYDRKDELHEAALITIAHLNRI